MAIFRAMVELAVKATWSGRGQPSSRAARHRVSYTVREAATGGGIPVDAVI